MIEQATPPRDAVLKLAREQRFHTSTVTIDLLGVSQGAFQRWEHQPTAITDAEYADALAVYLCDTRDNKDTPMNASAQQSIRTQQPAMYDSLMRHLMGNHYTPYLADVPLNAAAAASISPTSALDAASAAHQAKIESYAGKSAHELLSVMAGARNPDALHQQLSAQLERMSPSLAASFTRARLDALLSGAAVPSMIEQVALIGELKPETTLKDAFAAACRKAEAAGRG